MPITSPAKIYPSVGRCIYCGTTEGDLGREHILAYALGGNLILPKASCRSCGKVTGQTEQTCLRTMLGPTRIRLGLPTRRPKERPKSLPLLIVAANGSTEQRHVPIEQYPAMLAMVAFPPPGIFTGAPPSHIVQGALWTLDDEGQTKKLLKVHKARAFRMGLIQAEIFMRMLAKIAHSYAVAQLGIGAFTPLLPEFILKGSPETASTYVGGDLELSPAEDALHSLTLSYKFAPRTRYLVVSIRLFAMLGTPLYHVVVGEG